MDGVATGAGLIVPVQTRRDRPTGTSRADFELPASTALAWRFSPVQVLAEFLSGTFASPASEVNISGCSSASLVASETDRSDSRLGLAGLPEDVAAGIAWESDRVTVLTLSGSQSEDIVVTFSSEPSPHARHILFVAEEGSSAPIVVVYDGLVRMTEIVEHVIGSHAEVSITYCVSETPDSIHLSSHLARVDRDARLEHSVVVLSGGVTRINPSAQLLGEGGAVNLLGLDSIGESEHVEHHVYVNHDAPHTKSNVLYKGVLRSSSSRAVWIGDVLISSRARGTDSYEQNRNLILADGARADSIPNLEIETGDIVGAGHASATGRFDEDELFYLMSRGLSEPDARKLIVRGFLNEVAQQITTTSVQPLIERTLDTQFSQEVAR